MNLVNINNMIERAIDSNNIEAIHLIMKHLSQIKEIQFDFAYLNELKRNGKENYIRFCIEFNPNDDKANAQKLQDAMSNNRITIVWLLLDLGINLNAGDNFGTTPLHDMVCIGRYDCVKMLLDNGADPTIKDSFGFTPIDDAFENNQHELLRLFNRYGFDTSIVKNNDADNIELLNNAIICEYENIVRLLLKNNVDVEISNNEGQRPLHIATQDHHEDFVLLLLEYGANVNAQDNQKQTPLHIAAMRGFYDVVQLLLQHGADVGIKDVHERTPYDLAVEYEYNDIVLLMHGVL